MRVADMIMSTAMGMTTTIPRKRTVIMIIMRMAIRMVSIRTAMIITTIMMSIATTSITITNTAIPMLMTTNRPERPAAGSVLAESEAAALYRLMTWLSPAFPVGAFSYSSGIEWAVEA